MDKDRKISSFSIGAAYVGTIVGAGFASGQETLQFFFIYGFYGIIGIVISTLLFILLGYSIMYFGMIVKADNHYDIIKYLAGEHFGGILDKVIVFFLVCTYTSMIAGADSLFNQFFGIEYGIGAFIMYIIATVTVLKGFSSVINSIGFVAPFLVLSVVAIGIMAIINNTENIKILLINPDFCIVHNWLVSSILYVSYNIILAVSVLAPIGKIAKTKNSLLFGAVFGGAGLGISLIAAYSALSKYSEKVCSMDLPLAAIAYNISSLLGLVYIAILFLEVYTTAVGALFGISSRLSKYLKSDFFAIIFTSTMCLFASSIGFINFVSYVYPIAGVFGFVFVIVIIYRSVKNIITRQKMSPTSIGGEHGL